MWWLELYPVSPACPTFILEFYPLNTSALMKATSISKWGTSKMANGLCECAAWKAQFKKSKCHKV
jgi:hypothetical protein